MKKFKKTISIIMVIALFSPVFAVPVSAAESKKSGTDVKQIAEITSSEFPDAYILSEYYDKNSFAVSANNGKVSISVEKEGAGSEDEKTLVIKDPSLAQALEDDDTEIVGVINATVFFEEEYEITSNQGQDSVHINNSRLLTREEVASIGVENFESTNQMPTRESSTTYNSRGRLGITFVMSTLSAPGYAKAYNLSAYSTWNGMPLFPGLSGADDPGYGDDFMGFTWGGQYDYYNPSASATRQTLGAQNVYLTDVLPGSGLVWSFEEFNYYHGIGYDYVTNANCSCNIRKANLTGGGNTTAVVFKYIHTYQTHSGSISITAGTEGVAGTFSLNGVSKQWSLACSFHSMPY